MPRPKKPGAPPPKRRSRNGCWSCKERKVKCDEERPTCSNCQRTNRTCDYSIRLNWDGRKRRKSTVEEEVNRPASTAGFAAFHVGPGPALGAGQVMFTGEHLPGMTTTLDSTGWEGLTWTGHAEGSAAAPIGHMPSRKRAKSGHPEDDGDRGLGGPDATTNRTHAAAVSPASTCDSRHPWGTSVPSFNSPVTSRLSSHSPHDHEQRQASAPVSTCPGISPPPDMRRLSVSSLLSSSSGVDGGLWKVVQTPTDDPGPQSRGPPAGHCFGVDRGLVDLDLGRNDDATAISGLSPTIPDAWTNQLNGLPANFAHFAFGAQPSSDGYYGRMQVDIVIPNELLPLPPRLLENKMNLLYFHHFLNHTAHVLVPHDDPQFNPFRTVLPMMAVKHDNLLSLLLAYSAAHRARHLKYPEPQIRIATWVRDVLPALATMVRHIQAPDRQPCVSTADIATAIMLASLEIVSPASLGGDAATTISWQTHLGLAREIISHRPGGLRGSNDPQEEQVCAFLWSWFAYLDVVGSMSGGRGAANTAWSRFMYDGGSLDQIDCVMGITRRCVHLLARIADLAKSCDIERIDRHVTPARIRPNWCPSASTASEAAALHAEVIASIGFPTRNCGHAHATLKIRAQMLATNACFHWAGLVHLHRRVQGKGSEHPDIVLAVGEILGCLEMIEYGGPAEACLLFPMFTAGCELENESLRAEIMKRIRTVEETGMTQVSATRKLLEKVWELGYPWETLLSTEFIG